MLLLQVVLDLAAASRHHALLHGSVVVCLVLLQPRHHLLQLGRLLVINLLLLGIAHLLLTHGPSSYTLNHLSLSSHLSLDATSLSLHLVAQLSLLHVLLVRVKHLARREVVLIRRGLHVTRSFSSHERHAHRLQHLRLQWNVFSLRQRGAHQRSNALYPSHASSSPTLHRVQLGKCRRVPQRLLRALLEHPAQREHVHADRGVGRVQLHDLFDQVQSTPHARRSRQHCHLELWTRRAGRLHTHVGDRERLLRLSLSLQLQRERLLVQQSTPHALFTALQETRTTLQHLVHLGDTPSRRLGVIHRHAHRVDSAAEVGHGGHGTLQQHLRGQRETPSLRDRGGGRRG